jgi:hypothetical protein
MSNRRTLIGVAGLVALAIILIVAVLFLGGSKKNKVSSKSTPATPSLRPGHPITTKSKTTHTTITSPVNPTHTTETVPSALDNAKGKGQSAKPVKNHSKAKVENGVPVDELSPASPLGVVSVVIDKKKLPAEQAITAHKGQTVVFKVKANRIGDITLSGFNLSTKTIIGKFVELRVTVQDLSTYTLSFDSHSLVVLSVLK